MGSPSLVLGRISYDTVSVSSTDKILCPYQIMDPEMLAVNGIRVCPHKKKRRERRYGIKAQMSKIVFLSWWQPNNLAEISSILIICTKHSH